MYTPSNGQKGVQVDYLILADRAEAVNGKIYMVGGGWDRLGLLNIPGPADFDVCAGLLVAYNETNAPHQILLALEDEDNKVIVGPVMAQFEIGRPAGLKLGQTQRFQMVVRGPFPLPRTGAYHWVLSVDGERLALTKFWVDQVQVAVGIPPPTKT